MSEGMTLTDEDYPRCLGCGTQLGEYWQGLPGYKDIGQPWCAAKGCYPRRRPRTTRGYKYTLDPVRLMPASIGRRQQQVLREVNRKWLTTRQVAEQTGLDQHIAHQALYALFQRQLIERRERLDGWPGYEYHWTPSR